MDEEKFVQLIGELILDAAFESGFTVGENDKGETAIYLDIHGKTEVTEQMFDFGSHLIKTLLSLADRAKTSS